MTRKDIRRVIGSTDVYSRKYIDKKYDSLHRRVDLYGDKISELREEVSNLKRFITEMMQLPVPPKKRN